MVDWYDKVETVAMVVELLVTFTVHATVGVVAMVVSAVRLALRGSRAGGGEEGCTFYEGVVYHCRKAPARNAFSYRVRMAVVDLDAPPSWFVSQLGDYLSPDRAREMAGTKGRVKLLTHPRTAGYAQNPISVYYCMDGQGRLERCIAEVTNTPWGASVTFCFDQGGHRTPKALHVSPFMDMSNEWRLVAPMPGETVSLTVAADHPTYGDYFIATFKGKASALPRRRNEDADLATLWRFGAMPHRVAFWIYWQAVVLAFKGVSVHAPPGEAYKADVARRAEALAAGGAQAHRGGKPGGGGLCPFVWRPPARFPWRKPGTPRDASK